MKIKYKHIILLTVLGVVFNISGALLKVLHWQFTLVGVAFGGSLFLIIAAVLWIFAALLVIVKILKEGRSGVLNE